MNRSSRHTLLASVVLSALMASGTITKAQIPVTDVAHIALDTKDFAMQIAQMKRDYDVAVGTMGQLVRGLDPNILARQLTGGNSALGDLGSIGGSIIGMGRDTMQLAGLARGVAGMAGGGFNIASLMGMFSSQNTYYMPQSTGPNDFNAVWLQRQGNSLNAVQALATRSIQSAQDRIAGLDEIGSSLSDVSSAADVAAVQGRLNVEQAKLAAMQLEMQSTIALAGAQMQSYEQQALQRQRKSADQLIADDGTIHGDDTVQAQAVDAMPVTFSSLAGGG